MAHESNGRLKALPSILLESLGRAGSLDRLAKALESAPNFAPPLRHVRDGNPYTINAVLGLDMMLQCVNASAIEEERRWGLQSFTLQAGEWNYGWPEGLNPATATAKDVVKLFNADPNSSLVTQSMVCFTVPGLNESQQWSVLCLFDAATHRLQSFCLVRVGDWLPEEQPA